MFFCHTFWVRSDFTKALSSPVHALRLRGFLAGRVTIRVDRLILRQSATGPQPVLCGKATPEHNRGQVKNNGGRVVPDQRIIPKDSWVCSRGPSCCW